MRRALVVIALALLCSLTAAITDQTFLKSFLTRSRSTSRAGLTYCNADATPECWPQDKQVVSTASALSKEEIKELDVIGVPEMYCYLLHTNEEASKGVAEYFRALKNVRSDKSSAGREDFKKVATAALTSKLDGFAVSVGYGRKLILKAILMKHFEMTHEDDPTCDFKDKEGFDMVLAVGRALRMKGGAVSEDDQKRYEQLMKRTTYKSQQRLAYRLRENIAESAIADTMKEYVATKPDGKGINWERAALHYYTSNGNYKPTNGVLRTLQTKFGPPIGKVDEKCDNKRFDPSSKDGFWFLLKDRIDGIEGVGAALRTLSGSVKPEHKYFQSKSIPNTERFVFRRERDELVSKSSPGDIHCRDQFISASFLEKSAPTFQGFPVLLKIKASIGVPVVSIAEYVDEAEFLIPAGTCFKMISKDEKEEGGTIKLEVVLQQLEPSTLYA